MSIISRRSVVVEDWDITLKREAEWVTIHNGILMLNICSISFRKAYAESNELAKVYVSPLITQRTTRLHL